MQYLLNPSHIKYGSLQNYIGGTEFVSTYPFFACLAEEDGDGVGHAGEVDVGTWQAVVVVGRLPVDVAEAVAFPPKVIRSMQNRQDKIKLCGMYL